MRAMGNSFSARKSPVLRTMKKGGMKREASCLPGKRKRSEPLIGGEGRLTDGDNRGALTRSQAIRKEKNLEENAFGGGGNYSGIVSEKKKTIKKKNRAEKVRNGKKKHRPFTTLEKKKRSFSRVTKRAKEEFSVLGGKGAAHELLQHRQEKRHMKKQDAEEARDLGQGEGNVLQHFLGRTGEGESFQSEKGKKRA